LRVLAAAAAVCVFGAALAPQVKAATFTALTSEDAQLYGAAFQAAEKGDQLTIQDLLQRVSDPCLAGYVELKRLMAPQGKASFEELSGWLDKYAELPDAERVAKLAEKRAPKGSGFTFRLPFFPQAAVYTSAREAFYSGDPKTAYALAIATRERWIAGLSAFRLKDYAEARKHFEQVARDTDEDEWLRAAAAYWAARTAITLGHAEEAPGYLKLAARWPQTFYGMIAESQLGLEPGAGARVRTVEVERPYQGGIVRAAYTGAPNPQAQALVAGDARAKRAVALMQVGQTEEAAAELRRALVAARTDAERGAWIALAVELNTEAQSAARSRGGGYREFSYEDFPTPDLQPQGGYTVDKALVFALVKQESRFNPAARSYAGAVGLMQIKASTAAEATGDDSLRRGSALSDPAVNLRAGQAYLDKLLRDWTDGDLVRTVAAYNGGPGAVLKAHRYAGSQDSLMVVETLPAAQTREYVEKVMANYWTYRRLFGQKTRSIDAIASGVNSVDARLDR
jgi:soluble lytic murein transglycosylase-like protein